MQSYRQYRQFHQLVEQQLQKTEGKQHGGINPQGTAAVISNAVSAEIRLPNESENHIAKIDILPNSQRPTYTVDASNATELGVSGSQRSKKGYQEGEKAFIVGYRNGKDAMDPHNWTLPAKVIATAHIGAITLVAGIATAIDATISSKASSEFGVSETVETLATGLFIIGFGCSGFVVAPLSETLGRNPIYIGSLILFVLFTMASGLAPNLGSQVTFRFFAGFFASTPFTLAGGSLADLWSPMERIYAFPIFATTGFMGPVIGQVVGGFIADSASVSWRWTEWTTLIIAGIITVSMVLFQPETFTPMLLKWKAHHIRKLTGDSRYHAPIEVNGMRFFGRLKISLCRPFVLSIREPIIILFSAYLTVIYVILFGFLPGYSFIFRNTYHISQGSSGLMFIGIGAGLWLATALVPLILSWAKRDLKKLQESALAPVSRLPPEHTLWFAILGAPAIPISLFWMGWTAFPSISYWSPLLAGTLFGYGILAVYISTYQYIISSYEIYAASALALTSFVRFLAAGGVLEATIPMYHNLGVHWTLTVFAFIALAFTPVPGLFYKFGPAIRRYSKYAVA